MSVEVRLQRCAKYLAKNRHVKRRCLHSATYRRLQRFWRPIDDPGERSLDRCVSSISENVLRHGTMRDSLEPGLVQGGEQHTCITVAQVGFPSGWLLQPAHGCFHHAARTVTSTREPYSVVALVVGDIEKRLCARFVVPGEMALRGEALRMENDFRRSVGIQRSGQNRDSLSIFL